MFCPQNNSYLQREIPMDPRLINKAVRRAMRKPIIAPDDEVPSQAQRLESMQPSLFAPGVDITQAHLGYGRPGLRIVARELVSDDPLIQSQAVHTVLDKVQQADSALYLIDLNVIYNVVNLVTHSDALIREKSILILTHLSNYYQGKQRIMKRPVIIDHFINIFWNDCKEIRYVAALCLKTLARDRCTCEKILKNDRIIETLLQVVRKDHTSTVVYMLNVLRKLMDYDQERPLKANAFQIMWHFMKYHDNRIIVAAMECMTQLCKHRVGKKLADQHDMLKEMRLYLLASDVEVMISAAGLLHYLTLTDMSKWRCKQFQWDMIQRLVTLAVASNLPSLQLRCIQVLINLCDCNDIREHIRFIWKEKIQGIKVKTHESWNGYTEFSSFGYKTGFNNNSMSIEGVETIRTDYGEHNPMTDTSFLRRIREAKMRLLKVIDTYPYI
uniref:SFRICE_005626 n=1 Tax=Spodoptera frugiperda TaxID=7108 RepID=A0A2H1W6S7_SPOFR